MKPRNIINSFIKKPLISKRVLTVLSLCILAQKKGHRVNFEYKPYGVDVIHYVSSETSETGLAIGKWISIPHDSENSENRLNEAEAYLKGLIA